MILALLDVGDPQVQIKLETARTQFKSIFQMMFSLFNIARLEA